MGSFIKTMLVFMGGIAADRYCAALAKKVGEASDDWRATCGPIYNAPYIRKTASRCLECCYDVVFESRKDAEAALAAMAETIKKYGRVSLADLYEIAGIDLPLYAARRYVWLSINDGKVFRCREGYFIKLPKPLELK